MARCTGSARRLRADRPAALSLSTVAWLLGTCSADCTTVEGHECCTFAAAPSHVTQCGTLGTKPGDDKVACGQHCLDDPSCFWTYSAGGGYDGDCQLLGACGGTGANKPTTPAAGSNPPGTMHSAGCYEWGAGSAVRHAPPRSADAF